MGRPALIIEEDRLRFFVDNGFKVNDMAIICGVSKRDVCTFTNYCNLANFRCYFMFVGRLNPEN